MIPALVRFRREVRELQTSQPELHIKTISKQTNKQITFKVCYLTLPRISTGNLELSNTGFTLSPDKNPSTGLKLSKITSYLALSSDYNMKKKDDKLNNHEKDSIAYIRMKFLSNKQTFKKTF